MSTSICFFPYQWNDVSDNSDSELQVFSFIKSNEVVCIRILGFRPHLYIHLEDTSARHVTLIKQKIGWGLHDMKLVKRGALYENRSVSKDYLYVEFKTARCRSYFVKNNSREMKIYEGRVSAHLQLFCKQNIRPSSWLQANCTEVPSREKVTTIKEYYVSHQGIKEIEDNQLPSPLVMSIDIEVYAHDINVFPDFKHPEDKVFQIACALGRQGSPESTWTYYLLTLGKVDTELLSQSDVPIQCLMYSSETALLLGYVDLIRKTNPQIILGYNTYKFDNQYLVERAKYLHIYDNFVTQGYTSEKSKIYQSEWSSSAYSNQEFYFIDAKGRIFLDVMVLIQREHKLASYKLKSVAPHFLGDGITKDPLTHYDIAMCYEEGVLNGNGKAISIVGAYCVQDALLPLSLFNHLKHWYALTSMSRICSVTLADLLTRGQQIKVFSQICKFCYDEKIVLEVGMNTGNKWPCKGAYVLDALRGLHTNSVSFDFASLYPSIIISHNIDYTTQAPEHVRDDKCHIIAWEEHINCKCLCSESKPKEGIQCRKLKFRWLKEPRGILPTILESLLSERKRVKLQMKQVDKNDASYSILDCLQNALKISANSAYGALNPQTGQGLCPFPVGAHCITAVGRQSIEKVCNMIEEKYNGITIYGDTDSNYVTFKNVSLDELTKYSYYVADEITKCFKQPMKLAFEEKIYKHYLLLSKKRYIYVTIKNTFQAKGVLLARRDTAKIVGTIYRDLVDCIFALYTEEQLWERYVHHLKSLNQHSADNYVITMSIKTIDNLVAKPDDKNPDKIAYGSYKVPIATADKMKAKHVQTAEEFYKKSLPGQVQLAIRMKERGQAVENGARITYLFTKRGGPKASATEKMEEIEYFQYFYEKNFIDYFYYFKLLHTPVSELFIAAFGTTPEKENRIVRQLKKLEERMTTYYMLSDKLVTMFQTKVEFKGESILHYLNNK